jgi:Zn-dependent protease with chaperone function
MSTFDFRAQQERTRWHTVLLVLLFVAMAAVISGAIGVVAAVVLASELGEPGELRVDPAIVVMAGGLVIVFILAVALVRIATFGGDGARVAQSLGAEEVTEDTANPYKRRYLNIVEEMAIAASLPRPRAFVLKHEQGINAFAAGNDPSRAAVGVTHGALAKLSREELAGVVAHEMAHIANLDTRLNMRLMGMVFGLVILYVLGRGMLRSSLFMRGGGRRDGRTVALAVALGVTMAVLGSLGVLAGRVLQSTISRRREYLADATGVQFTRNPAGLANALKKIGGTQSGSRVHNADAEEARHMFFAAATGSFAGLFATHPPLVDRIRALEPDFDPGTDPVWAKDDRAVLRETHAELAGPWG